MAKSPPSIRDLLDVYRDAVGHRTLLEHYVDLGSVHGVRVEGETRRLLAQARRFEDGVRANLLAAIDALHPPAP